MKMAVKVMCGFRRKKFYFAADKCRGALNFLQKTDRSFLSSRECRENITARMR